MPCIVVTPEIRELASQIPSETLSSVRNMVGIWQEREIAKGNDSVTSNSVPDVTTLKNLYMIVRNSKIKTETVIDKEDLEDLLDDEHNFPESLVSLSQRLGVSIKKNRKTHTLSISSNGGTNNDIRLFKALAVDLIYQSDAAENAFGMSARERLAAIIDWQDQHYKSNNYAVRSLMDYELQLAQRRLRDDYDISTDGEMEAMRKQAAEQFTSKERMERINDIVYWFDKLLTERHEGKLKQYADRREELLKAKAEKDKSKYSGVVEAEEKNDHLRSLLETKWSDLGISVRAFNRFKEKGIETVADVVKYNRPMFQKWTNLDSKTLKEIVDLVDKLGLSFGMDVDNLTPAEDSVKWETVEAAYDKELGDIQRESGAYDRMAALKEYGPNNIMNDIRQKFVDLAQISDDAEFIQKIADEFKMSPNFTKANLAWYRKQVKAVADNFLVLADEAGRELEVTELVRISLKQNDVTDIKNDNPNQEENDEGKDENDVDGIENQYKENWMFEYDTTSNWSKTPAQVRRMLYRCKLGGRFTRFGTPYRMQVMEVINTLIEEMQGIDYSTEMDELFELLAKENPWIKDIQDEIANDEQLKTNLFLSITRYGQSLGIIERSGKKASSRDMTKSRLKIVNSAKTVNSIYTGIVNQLASGVPLNKRYSIYNSNLDLDESGLKHVKDILDSYSDDDWKEIVGADPSQVKDIRSKYPNIIKDIKSVLTSLGVSISENDIRIISARDVRQKMVGYKNNLGGLFKLADQLISQLETNGYETVDDLINENGNTPSKSVMRYYRDIAKLLTLTDRAAIEPSVREKGKLRYSNVLRSTLDDLIIGLQGKRFSHVQWNENHTHGERVNMTPAEFVISKFGDDPSFATKTESADGTITYHFRNHILEEIVNGGTYYTPSYVTILNADVAGRDKQEQKNLTQNDRLNMMWSMYHMNENADERYENTKGYWFPIPLPSDSGRIAYISFLPVADEARQDEIIKEAITKELERMTDDSYEEYDAEKEKNNPVISEFPDTYRKNKNKFCNWTFLNDKDIAGYTVKEIKDAYIASQNLGKVAEFNQVLKDLVGVVRKSIVEKFQEENEDYYNARVKAEGQTSVDELLLEESLFQLSMNEILNGDPAYYSGYNTGSDNIQKRAKQSIVPKSKLDIYNKDFQDLYKSYHGIDLTEELDPEDITIHCLYISDPTMPSPSLQDLIDLYDNAVADGIIDQTTRDDFVRSSSDIKHTDGQAFYGFQTMKMMMYASGRMKKGDALDSALDRIAEGRQQEGDVEIVKTADKPFADGLVPIRYSDGSVRLQPVQLKISVQLLTAALIQAQGTKIGASPALRALSRFMEEQRADMAVFTSGVKVGQDGAVRFGEVDPESATEDEIYNKFVSEAEKYRSATGKSIIHEIPYSFYGYVAENPDSGLDESEIPIGTQLQKLLPADLPDKIKIKYFDSNGPQERYETAIYHVEGVGDLTRDEILALYNKLMTAKIQRGYEEMKGVFESKQKLSEALIRSCRNSSRNSAYLERAFSLDEHGNFVIPLCDMATMNMSSEFLNSIVKNAVSKIKVPGKQLVSMSAFGFANELKIEFERDEDGNPIRYESIDCLMPAWSRHIIAKCINEKGILDFNKLANESPDLLRMIGLRIPTQFKNFILPLRVVGFLPTILGDTIVTAIDSVNMLDADFDNDKVPTIFPSFTADYHVDNWEKKIARSYNAYFNEFYDRKKLNEDYDKYINEYYANNDRRGENGIDGYGIYDFVKDRKDALGLDEFNKQYRKPDAPDGEPMSMREYTKEHESEYLRPDGPKLKYIAYDPNVDVSDQSDEAINNGIINVMYGMLTGRAVSTMSIASGSTAKLKVIKRELEGIIPKKKYTGYDGPADIASRIGQETKNNDGKQMISVFANAEAMQAILQHTRVGILPQIAATINGRTLNSLHDITIEGTLDYISRYIGTALGGAADNSKDPILSVMNINLRTAPVVSLMLQLGYTMREVAFFLNIPSIRHFTDTGNYGKYKDPNTGELPKVLPGTIEQMTEAIKAGDNPDDMDDDMFDYCNTALGVYTYLSNIGERMRAMSALVRGDSGSSAPHGPVENNLVRFLNYELFAEAEAENPIFENWKDIIDYDYNNDASSEKVNAAADPIAQAYITYGVVGAFRKLAEYYPGIDDPNFRNQIKNIIKKFYGGVANAYSVKNVMYSLYNYVESSFDCIRKEGLTAQESRNYYINYFPEEAARILSEHPELLGSLLFRRLKLFSSIESDDNPYISMLYEGNMLAETRDEFTSVWQQMFYAKKEDGTTDKEVRDLALELFKYGHYRNGWRFGPGTYSHLAPAEARLFFPGYNEMLRSMQRGMDAKVYDNFEIQFIRNNLRDRRICPQITTGKIKFLEKGIPVDHVTIKDWSKLDKAHQDAYKDYFEAGDESPRPAFYISDRVSGNEFNDYYYVKVGYNELTGESLYALTTPLGVKDQGVEYSANEPGISMPSSFDQKEISEVIRDKKRGNKRSASTSNKRNSLNDSESPNENDDDTDFWGRPKKSSRKTKTSERKETKGKNTSSKKAKSKNEVKKERDGGKKSKSKYKVAKDTSSHNRIMDVESRCAREIGAYTISIVDSNSSQLNTAIGSAASKLGKTHFITRPYESKSVNDAVKELVKNLSSKSNKSIVLNLTGSYMNTMKQFATQEDLDAFAMKIYQALRSNNIYVSKVVSTAQPGMPLASTRAAMKLGYNLELHPTVDFKVYGKNGEAPSVSSDLFWANIDVKNTSKEYKSDSKIYDKEDGPFIVARNEWTRDIVMNDKKTLYVFEDTSSRTSGVNSVSPGSTYAKRWGGYKILKYPNSGSAVARGANNAFPISTMKTESEKWSDSDFNEFKKTILSEINDIIDAFEDSGFGFKRVVLPVNDLLENLPSKFHGWFSDRMEELESRINEIAETEADNSGNETNDEIGGFEIDKNDMLAWSDIKTASGNDENATDGNIRLIDLSILEGQGIKILNSANEEISSSDIPRIFMLFPGGRQDARIEGWSKAKLYTADGRITEDVFFRLTPNGRPYNLLTASENGLALASNEFVARSIKVLGIKQMQRLGMKIDDEGNPLCN